MEDIDDLFDVFDESNNDTVGLYLPGNEETHDITKLVEI